MPWAMWGRAMDKAVEAILQSKLLAKVVIEGGRQLEIVAVFEKSEYYRFFFVFTAKSAGAAQATWELKRTSSILGMTVFDLDTFVANEIRLNFRSPMTFTATKLYCKAEDLREFIHRVGHPLEYVKPQDTRGMTFDRVNRKNGRSGRGFWFNQRNTKFDSLPTPTNEVLVYEDFCTECGKRHNIPHFPSGSTKCMDYMKLKEHPGLEYTGHKDGMFIFKYRVGFPAHTIGRS